MGQTEDPLLPSALRLARFYALLSPGILQQELGVDRPRAERLIESLVERGALGPVFVERSGARESLVNMVNERTGEVSLPPGVPIARASASRRAVVATSLGIVLGLATCIALILAGLSERFVGLLGIPSVSPSLARVLALLAVPPATGWGLGALAQKLLSPDEEAVPYGALRVRQTLWTLYAAGAIGFGAWQLFR